MAQSRFHRFLCTIALISLCLSNIDAYSYDKLLNNTSWKAGYKSHHGQWQSFWYHSKGDTILNQKTYTILENTSTDYWVLYYNPKYQFLREDTINKKAYILDTNMTTELLLYDFGVGIGDSIIPTGAIRWANPLYLTANKIDTISTPWGLKRVVYFDSTNTFSGHILLEGVGWVYRMTNGLWSYRSNDLRGFSWGGTQWSFNHYITACIYKNRIQTWENFGSNMLVSCESMCPSIGIQDSLNVNSKTICPGDSVFLEAPCDSTGYWSLFNSPSVVLDSADSIWVKPSQTTKYLWHGSLKVDTAEIIVRKQFSLDLGKDTGACINETFILKPLVSDTLVDYYWSNFSTSTSLKLTRTGVYWVLGKDKWGCFSASDTMNFTSYPTPIVSVDSFIKVGLNYSAISLKSGLPVGGVYFGQGVNSQQQFDPQWAGTGTHNVGYTYIDSNGCADTAYTIFEVVDYSGIINSDTSDFKFYPNPTDGKLTLEIQEMAVLSIYNLQGVLIEKHYLYSGKNEIKTDLIRGSYLLSLQTNSGIYQERLIVN